MSEMIDELQKLKESKNIEHEAVLQVKIPAQLRLELQNALESDQLTVKDLVLVAIRLYLSERNKLK